MAGTTVDRVFNRASRGRYYDDMLVQEFFVANFDYGAGALAFTFGKPEGTRFAKLLSIQISNVTEIFNSVNSGARVELGNAADPNRYVDFFLNDLAVGATQTLEDTPTAISGAAYADGLIDLDAESISQIDVGLVSPVGGTPTGIADTRILVGFF